MLSYIDTTKKYGEKTVVNNLRLSVDEGTIFGLLS
jgi:ABC-type multidrug transport system ATPase subunit